jgi:hypothetical protein
MARGEKFWEKVLAALDAGETQRVVAERFGVSVVKRRPFRGVPANPATPTNSLHVNFVSRIASHRGDEEKSQSS